MLLSGEAFSCAMLGRYASILTERNGGSGAWTTGLVTELDQLGTSRGASLPSASRRWCLKPSRGSRCCANPHLSRDAVLINSTKAHGFCLPGAPLSRYPHTLMGVQMAPPFPPTSTLPLPPLHLLGTCSSTPSVPHQAESMVSKCP